MDQQVPPILIIQTGSPADEVKAQLGDFPDWFCAALERPVHTVEVVRVFAGEPLPQPDVQRVTIITGSAAMVTERQEWSERTAHWIRKAMAMKVPLLGVCYGHQLMADALGGIVGYLASGREIGCQRIHVLPTARQDPLLKDWPPFFSAHLTHEQTVISLPPGASVLGYSASDEHQIIRYSPQALSVQFHPEFTPAACAAIIRQRADTLRGEGRDVETLLAGLTDTPEAMRLLRRFVEAG